ncbi:glutathione S-transferase family protein [Glaciecola sp. MH2013]|uniref:glutathione S-transferase family protein n=1 Tax=Glaciecola sp. MH2013 TaxID=2785524 RepID=UPI00189E6105|nr:glutathione S-transferase family protein [Glaciecola sp. MH2013]MBF7074097.1 glutathione S-transferase family protein [Glaciecola sp. MH2013]
MKIYDTKTAPTPRRVRIFLAEKNISMEYVQVDLQKGENLSAEMREKNPIGKIPILELDDGSCIGESDAICTYFEALQPEPPLMGVTPLQKAQIAMWQRQVDLCLFMQVGMCFQHTTGYFKDRMTPVKDYGVEAGKNAAKYLSVLDRQLQDNEFVAGDTFSIADITTLCSIDFARVIDVRIAEKHSALQSWYDRIAARESAKA